MKTLPALACLIALTAGLTTGTSAAAQQPQGAPTPPPVERLGPNLLRVGNIRVDTAAREFAVAGVTTGVSVLEFVAGTQRGNKGYETAIELETDGVTFNTACLLIGLDPSHSVKSERHFDPRAPQGDPVEIAVSWDENGATRRIDAEQLLYDREKKQALSGSRWVYTGSVVMPNGRYLADLDGVLIGFVHTPAPVIENVAADGVGRYGAIIFNPELGLKPKTRVTMIVRAVQAGAK